MSDDIVLRVGRYYFTRADILSLMSKVKRENPVVVLAEEDYEGVLAYMHESWAGFPVDLHINDTDPHVWLRKEEMDCTIYIYLACRDRQQVSAEGQEDFSCR